MVNDTNKLISMAKEGDRDALESIIKSIQDRIYRLALKMLYQPQDAEDATQEILIRIITKLDSFRQESSFATWAITIAVNHLKNKKQNQKENWFTFKRCEAAILKEIPDPSTLNYFKAEQNLVVEEMRIKCMQGLLQCLDVDHRFAYILGSTMGLNGPEGAAIMGITSAAFRKRLSRARESLRHFLTVHCDLFNGKNACNCASQAMSAINRGNIKSKHLKFAGKTVSSPVVSDVESELAALDTISREIALMRMNQDFQAPAMFIERVKQIIDDRIG